MSAASTSPRAVRDAQTIVIERMFDAPREMVYEAWTNPRFLVAWYAPRGCTIRFVWIDVRAGGKFHSCIHNPEFGDCWCVGEYLEVARPERIVYSMATADEQGRRIDAARAGHHPDWPAETVVSVTLEDLGGSRTKLTLEQNAPLELAKQTGAYPSWLQMLERLGEHLAG
ncbi:MAG TPA: SRPBCC domain-containing protein [Steroidobacteraceae bacterium]|nr:SRPBCC domain-containing protein [Steroidobacteraceae bacterium]